MKLKKMYFIIIALMLFITSAFAIIASDIKINSNVKIKGQTWSVYFDNVVNVSAYNTLDIDNVNKTKILLNLDINYGETKTFKVDANNRGTLNAYIKSINLNLLNYGDSLSYTLKNIDSTDVEIGQQLYMYSTDTYIIEIKYIGNDVGTINLTTDFIIDYGVGSNELPQELSIIGEIYDANNSNVALENYNIVIDNQRTIPMQGVNYNINHLSPGNHTITIRDMNGIDLASGSFTINNGILKRITDNSIVISSVFGANLYMYISNGNIEYSFIMPKYNFAFAEDDSALSENNLEISRYDDHNISVISEKLIEDVVCTNQQNVTFDNETHKIKIKNATNNSTCEIIFANTEACKAYTVGQIINFDYTGDEQVFTPLCDGYYEIEAWGAQGGTATDGSVIFEGGYGAYTSGTINLVKDENIYINVGGEGQTANNAAELVAGGYNGGGSAYGYKGKYLSSGGGATSVSFNTGLLKDQLVQEEFALYDDIQSAQPLTYYANSQDIILVAGGGGGAGYQTAKRNASGGHAGMYYAKPSIYVSDESTAPTNGKGATYKAAGSGKIAGSFGQGGQYTSSNGCGGGGGYYGGGAGSSASGGGGGSSYINNPRLLDKNYYAYDTEFNSLDVSETPKANMAKKGNGYVRVKYLGLTKESINEYSTDANYLFTAPKSGYYKLEGWGAQGGSYDDGTNSVTGGYGAYVEGTIYLDKGEQIYVKVGGRGRTAPTKSKTLLYGGYNGGGDGFGSTSVFVTSGGGLTSFTKVDNQTILLIAAGGGGSAYYNTSSYGNGGAGGEYSGENGTATNTSYPYGRGGTPTAGGTGKKAGASLQGGSANKDNVGSGGGGGYFGGGSSTTAGGGGGGSSYIGNLNLISKSMYSYDELKNQTNHSKTATSLSAKEGNGAAKITYLGPVIEDINKFSYPGVYQYVIKTSGYYRLEAWGAQGGSDKEETNSGIGGYGAYTNGTAYFNAGDIIYVTVGEEGHAGIRTNCGNQVILGGFNGGGQNYTRSNVSYTSGGGATHFATSLGTNSTGELKDLANFKDNILMVAAGGGGGMYHSATVNNLGGSGGELYGYDGITTSTDYNPGRGGTQTAAGGGGVTGAFGRGGNISSSGVGNGGGGGYYGGGAGGTYASGGGGSSYINRDVFVEKSMYGYNLNLEKDEHSAEPQEDKAKEGNGYAQITFVGNNIEQKNEFSYPGVYNYVIPKSGYYKLEGWGAQGGSAIVDNVRYNGGYGAYTTGTAYFNAGDVIYITVGGKGANGAIVTYKRTLYGGFNGGGNAYGYTSRYYTTGGGATHFATSLGTNSTGELKDLANFKENILIVAGGGGGAGYRAATNYGYGGAGGEYFGNNGTSSYTEVVGTGGTQTAAGTGKVSGAFGKGGAPTTNNGNGGGGGYYGGGAGSDGSGAGGGSSYVDNVNLVEKMMYSYNEYKNQLNYSEIATPNSAKIGDGYAKITFVGDSVSSPNEFSYPGFYKYTIPQNGYYRFEAWGAQGGNAIFNDGGNIIETEGGPGAYGAGIAYFLAGTEIYVTIGEAGTGRSIETVGSVIYGGYNGGGNGFTSTNVSSASGGGATHFAVSLGANNVGLLKDYSKEKGNIILVAAGGGGSSYQNATNYGQGGAGGGYSGNNSFSSNAQSAYGLGATQKAGGGGKTAGAFGQGGSMTASGSGGGGGYFGGGSGQTYRAGGGGSSYRSGYIIGDSEYYCLDCMVNSEVFSCYTLPTTNSSFNPIAKTAKLGNGYAKITYLGDDVNVIDRVAASFGTTNTEEVFVIPKTGIYNITAVGGSGGDGCYIDDSAGTCSYHCPDYHDRRSPGYVTGNFLLAKGTTLFINVGGGGSGGYYAVLGGCPDYGGKGGYNGGGAGTRGGGGGGASQVALISGLYSSDLLNSGQLLLSAKGGTGERATSYIGFENSGKAGGSTYINNTSPLYVDGENIISKYTDRTSFIGIVLMEEV